MKRTPVVCGEMWNRLVIGLVCNLGDFFRTQLRGEGIKALGFLLATLRASLPTIGILRFSALPDFACRTLSSRLFVTLLANTRVMAGKPPQAPVQRPPSQPLMIKVTIVVEVHYDRDSGEGTGR